VRQMLVRAVMTPSPVTVTEETTACEAMEAMRKGNFGRLLVTRGERLVGIVTELDLMRISPSVATTLSIWEQNALLAKMRIKEVMTADPVAIGPTATVEEAALLMRDLHISGLPVVEDGKLIGIVTERDLFDAFVDLMHAPAPGARITLRVVDGVGVLAKMTRVVSDLGISILAIAAFDDEEEQSEAHSLVVLKVDTQDTARLIEGLEAAGFPVIHQAFGGTPV
jgi:acetoin utilization protein AcuB